MPMTPFIGVRISWLMFARNADFIADASTASSRASAVGVVEFEQALQALVALAREQRDEPDRGSAGQRGDRRAVDLLGDRAAPRPRARRRRRRPSSRAAARRALAPREIANRDPGDREVDGELGCERGDEQPGAARSAARCARSRRPRPGRSCTTSCRLPARAGSGRTSPLEHVGQPREHGRGDDCERHERDRQREQQRHECELGRHREPERRVDPHPHRHDEDRQAARAPEGR